MFIKAFILVSLSFQFRKHCDGKKKQKAKSKIRKSEGDNEALVSFQTAEDKRA